MDTLEALCSGTKWAGPIYKLSGKRLKRLSNESSQYFVLFLLRFLLTVILSCVISCLIILGIHQLFFLNVL